jgi:hypothetical protein
MNCLIGNRLNGYKVVIISTFAAPGGALADARLTTFAASRWVDALVVGDC